jgi:hypothetical protein
MRTVKRFVAGVRTEKEDRAARRKAAIERDKTELAISCGKETRSLKSGSCRLSSALPVVKQLA